MTETLAISETALPAYSEEHLARLDPAALIDLMIADEDRVPRNVIDAAARLGDPMVAALQDRLAGPWELSDELGGWWLELHAAMTLGLIAQENAGLLLVELMRRMSIEEDDDLQDWLAGEWPALFANKPQSVMPRLMALCAERNLDWYIRANAVEPVLANAARQGNKALDDALAWVATIAADEQEDRNLRLCCGNSLLDFPREAHRPLVEDLARRQGRGMSAHFVLDDVSRAYAKGHDDPAWRGHGDPWKFYSPKAITERQKRWAEEREPSHDSTDDEVAYASPYVRDAPKIGRNDPCPCGSGKKYKKCCLSIAQA
ncbi:MAG TPA: SEC-C metal-binding domain-containing protein [Casimicrobiaceae bacterium]|nr:SEC-C metal-binding domain-containing protein [Casimicrobiaceae bacterium]